MRGRGTFPRVNHRASTPALLACLLAFACRSREAAPDPAERTPPAPASDERKAEAPADGERGPERIDFEAFDVDAVPPGFTPLETNGQGTPARWRVAEVPDAASGTRVFGIVETQNSGQTYNVALYEGASFRDGAVAVSVRAHAGEGDRGGGLVFRAQDADHYYAARWNPLENNARFYVVQGGKRTPLGRIDLEIEPGEWHRLEILIAGDRFELLVDERTVLTVTDATFPGPGKVGLWSKADAATWFDDLHIAPD